MDNNLKSLLIKYGFSFKKAYGQNFLTDDELLTSITEKAGVNKKTAVLEIGCGAGALTKCLASAANKVVGYEIDSSLKPLLEEVLCDFNNVEIVYKDVMKDSLKSVEDRLGGGYTLVANLPYYITTPIVMKFLENSDKIEALIIMVQEEVARRFAATAGSSDYGAITVAINLRGSAEIIERVPRAKFTPAPNVDSAVVKITIDRKKNADVDLASVRNAVRAGFSSRRKMLVNNLMNVYKLPRIKAEEALKSAGVSLTARGETLTESDYVKLADALKNL